MNLSGGKLFKILFFFILMGAFIQFFTKVCFCSPKNEVLLDDYYFQKFNTYGMRILWGGVNHSAASTALEDVRGGGIEFEYEKMDASAFFSGVIGLGYISLNDSSATKDQYLKYPFVKFGFNFVLFSIREYLNIKLGPDIKLLMATVAEGNDQKESHLGSGFGINLIMDLSIKKDWFLGGGIRQGTLYVRKKDLDTRYLFIQIQRNF